MAKLDQHLQNFKEYVKKSSSERTANNYHTTVKGFYRSTDRSMPINLEMHDSKLQDITDDIVEHVSSRSMKFGLKKYLDWRSVKSHKIESERTAQFLRNKLSKMEIESKTRDVESKVISAETLAQVCGDAGEKDEQLGLMLRMMYETGSRFSGMNRLLWRDVWRSEYSGERLKDHQVFISKDRSKGKVDGVVEISDRTLNELRELWNDRDPSQNDQVFFPEMTNPSTYQKAWRFFESKWPEYSTHYFRHSRLTHLGLKMHQEEGLEYSSVKERLRRYARHKNSDTTEIYIEIVKNKLAQKNQDMAQYRDPGWA